MKLMYKPFLAVSLLAVIVIAASCGNSSKNLSPKEVAKEFLTSLQELDYYTAQLHATEKSSQMLNLLKQASAGQEPDPKPFKILRDSVISDTKTRVYFIAIKKPKAEGDTTSHDEKEPEETYVNVKKVKMTQTQMLTKERDILQAKVSEYKYKDEKKKEADQKRLDELNKKLEGLKDDGTMHDIWLVDYTKESFMEDIDMGDMMGGEDEGDMEEDDMMMDEDEDMEEMDEPAAEPMKK